MAAVLLFQDTNMAAVTSCENAPYSSVFGRRSENFRNTCTRRKYTNDGSLREDDGLSQWFNLPKQF